MTGGHEEEGAGLLSTVPSYRTRNNGLKLNHVKFHLKTRKILKKHNQPKKPQKTKINIFTVRVVKQWHKLLRKVVESPSLEDTQNPTGHHNPGQPAVADTA